MNHILDSSYHASLKADPGRASQAMDFIHSLKDGPQPLESGSQLFYDVRSFLFFEFPNVQWVFTGTTAGVWGGPTLAAAVFASNWDHFLDLLN